MAHGVWMFTNATGKSCIYSHEYVLQSKHCNNACMCGLFHVQQMCSFDLVVCTFVYLLLR